MNTIYLIRTMNLIGAKLDIYTPVSISDNANFIYSGNVLMKVIDISDVWESNRYYKLSKLPIGYNSDTTELLPYFAKVVEDLPGSAPFAEPKIYEKCQLTTKYPNNYLIFKDIKTGKELKIALNSHIYEPIN